MLRASVVRIVAENVLHICPCVLYYRAPVRFLASPVMARVPLIAALLLSVVSRAGAAVVGNAAALAGGVGGVARMLLLALPLGVFSLNNGVGALPRNGAKHVVYAAQ